MKVIAYTPEHFSALRNAVAPVASRSPLLHQPFVDYYYATRDWCQLFLLVDKSGDVVGTLGVDRLAFATATVVVDLGFGSNFLAVVNGAGGILFIHWMRTVPAGLVFGGSQNTHRILRAQGWRYYPGVHVYALNRLYPALPGDSWWRRVAKRTAERVKRRPLPTYLKDLPRDVAGRIDVREGGDYATDLIPPRSPFAFRFAPSLGYLRWRYNTNLSFARYRLFRILASEAVIGFVVLKDGPEELVVSHADGSDPELLAFGILMSVLRATASDREARTVVLSSSHTRMQQVFTHFGFQLVHRDRPFAVGARLRPPDLPVDTADWLVNFDFGDNSLRPPFLD